MSELDGDSKLSSVESVFEKALGLEGEARAAFLARVSSEDAGLCARVKALLSAHGDEAGFLPGGDSVETLASEGVVSEEAGAIIGRFKLLEKLGEGGFGSVWAAEQREPVKRRVALKIIKLGMDTKQVVARFEAERQALALMDHPNISKVLDAGSTDSGRPYFVMELVKGIPITKYLERESLGVRDKLRLFIKVCQAIQHAHQKGIIHRDIKPSNVMVTLHDGEPVPKVIDFGIAKATQGDLTDKTIYTQYTQFIGTPAYMSPEQAEMSGLDVDTRSDIYSLGVLLYEILTGSTPFDTKELMASGIDEMRKIIRERNPVKPSTRLDQNISEGAVHPTQARQIRLSSDLDWIVLKCLEKDRGRRYETATGLAKDVERHLANDPVVACPPSAIYRLEKAWRRNRLAVSAGIGMAASLLIGLAASLWQTREARLAREDANQEAIRANQFAEQVAEESLRAKKAEERARAQAENERRMAYASDMNQAQHALKLGDLGTALQLLERHVPLGDEEDLRGWEWRWLRQKCQSDGRLFKDLESQGPGFALSISHDDQWLACSAPNIGFEKWKTTFYRVKTGERSQPDWMTDQFDFWEFCPLAPFALIRESNAEPSRYWLLNTDTGRKEWLVGIYSGESQWGFSADGSFLWRLETKLSRQQANVGFEGTFEMWDVKLGKSVSRLILDEKAQWADGAVSADGKYVVVNSIPLGTVSVYETRTGNLVWTQWISKGGAVGVEFTPDNRFLICSEAIHNGELQVRAIDSGELVGRLTGHSAYITSLEFLDDGKTLASAATDQTVRLWDLETRSEIQMLRGHREEIRSMVALGDGKSLLSCSFDGKILRWHSGRATNQSRLHYHQSEPLPLYVRESRMATMSKMFQTRLAVGDVNSGNSFLTINREWSIVEVGGRELDQFEVLGSVSSNFRDIVFSDESGMGAMVDSEGDVFACDLSEKDPNLRWMLNVPRSSFVKLDLKNDLLILLQELNRGQALLFVRYSDGSKAFERRLPSETMPMVVSADRRWLVTTNSRRQEPRLWDLDEKQLTSVPLDESLTEVWGAAISSDSQFLALNGEPHMTVIYHLPTGSLVKKFVAHLNGAKGVNFSADGTRMITGGLGGDAIKLWDTRTWRHLLTLSAPGQVMNTLRFCQEGNMLLMIDTDASAHRWRAPSWEEISDLLD